MQVIVPGHKYNLSNMEGGEQILQFIQKEERNGVFETVMNGTTNEEVLAMLIDRLQNLNAKFPCRENSIVITKLEESLMWLNKRTEDRKKRGVEGQNKA